MCLRKIRRHLCKSAIVSATCVLLPVLIVLITVFHKYGSGQWLRSLVSTKQRVRLTDNATVDCASLANNNVTELKRVNEIIATEKWVSIPNEDFLNLLQNCTQFIQEIGFDLFEKSSHLNDQTMTKDDKPVAFIVMVVDFNIEQLTVMLQSVYTQHNLYCLHVDKAADFNFLHQVNVLLSCFNNIFLSSERENLVASTFSIVRAQMNCMWDLLHVSTEWEYVVKLNSRDFPLVPAAHLSAHLQRLQGSNFIPSTLVPIETTSYFIFRVRQWESSLSLEQNLAFRHKLVLRRGGLELTQTSVPKRIPPSGQPLYFSETPHYVVTRDFAFYALTNDTAKQLFTWFHDIKDPDLFVWATLDHLYKSWNRTRNVEPQGHPHEQTEDKVKGRQTPTNMLAKEQRVHDGGKTFGAHQHEKLVNNSQSDRSFLSLVKAKIVKDSKVGSAVENTQHHNAVSTRHRISRTKSDTRTLGTSRSSKYLQLESSKYLQLEGKTKPAVEPHTASSGFRNSLESQKVSEQRQTRQSQNVKTQQSSSPMLKLPQPKQGRHLLGLTPMKGDTSRILPLDLLQLIVVKPPLAQASLDPAANSRGSCRHYDLSGQCDFTVADLPWLQHQNSLFAGPISVETDHFVAKCIQKVVQVQSTENRHQEKLTLE